MRAKMTWLLLTLHLASCAHVVQYREARETTQTEKHSVKFNYFLLGLIAQKSSIPEAALCPRSRLATLDMKMQPQDILVSLVTLGIYVPRHAQVSCSSL